MSMHPALSRACPRFLRLCGNFPKPLFPQAFHSPAYPPRPSAECLLFVPTVILRPHPPAPAAACLFTFQYFRETPSVHGHFSTLENSGLGETKGNPCISPTGSLHTGLNKHCSLGTRSSCSL